MSGPAGGRTFVLGITGGVGRRLASVLRDRGDEVGGLVRRPEQQDAFDELGIRTVVGSLADMDAGRFLLVSVMPERSAPSLDRYR